MLPILFPSAHNHSRHLNTFEWFTSRITAVKELGQLKGQAYDGVFLLSLFQMTFLLVISLELHERPAQH